MHRLLLLLAILVGAGGCAAAATDHRPHPPAGSAAQAPAAIRFTVPAPLGPHAATTQLVTDGLGTPTSFAFGAGQVFAGDAGATYLNRPDGGVFVVRGGAATRLAGSPVYVGGLAWHSGTLYVSGGPAENHPGRSRIFAWSGWNGTSFAHRVTIFTAPPRFEGFNGLAFGPDGRLYAGTDAQIGDGNDHGPRNGHPYLYDILSLRPDGHDVRVFARGIRQPWQLAFPPGSSSALVTNLGPDTPPRLQPPDLLLRVHAGADFGFPGCNWSSPRACRRFSRPVRFFHSHADPMGIAIVGHTVYLSEFGLGSSPPSVIAVPLAGGGGGARTVARFPRPIVGLGASGSTLYVGETDGRVFRLRVR